MKRFIASQELVDVLVKNGFVDDTPNYYPNYFQKMKEQGYNPQAVKRKFLYPSSRDFILLDYDTIVAVYNYCDVASSVELQEDELKSIIAFMKLSPEEKQAYHVICKNIQELYAKHRKMLRESGEETEEVLDKKFAELFESIQI